MFVYTHIGIGSTERLESQFFVNRVMHIQTVVQTAGQVVSGSASTRTDGVSAASPPLTLLPDALRSDLARAYEASEC